MQALPTIAAHTAIQSIPDNDVRIGSADVRALCAGVSLMTIHRWENNPDMNFPKPVYIGRRKYWRRAEIVAWIETVHANLPLKPSSQTEKGPPLMRDNAGQADGKTMIDIKKAFQINCLMVRFGLTEAQASAVASLAWGAS